MIFSGAYIWNRRSIILWKVNNNVSGLRYASCRSWKQFLGKFKVLIYLYLYIYWKHGSSSLYSSSFIRYLSLILFYPRLMSMMTMGIQGQLLEVTGSWLFLSSLILLMNRFECYSIDSILRNVTFRLCDYSGRVPEIERHGMVFKARSVRCPRVQRR